MQYLSIVLRRKITRVLLSMWRDGREVEYWYPLYTNTELRNGEIGRCFLARHTDVLRLSPFPCAAEGFVWALWIKIIVLEGNGLLT